MHAARLGIQCRELLDTGALALPNLGAEGDWLRAVRRGDVSFDEWRARIAELDSELESLTNNEALPTGPDRARIESWSVATHRSIWNQAE